MVRKKMFLQYIIVDSQSLLKYYKINIKPDFGF